LYDNGPLESVGEDGSIMVVGSWVRYASAEPSGKDGSALVTSSKVRGWYGSEVEVRGRVGGSGGNGGANGTE